LDQFAVETDSSPAGDPVVVYREQIGVGDRAGTVHFKFEKIFPINILRPVEAVRDRQTDLAIGICLYVRNIKSLSHFLGHVVAPRCARCSGNYWSGENRTDAKTKDNHTKTSHDV